MNDNKDDEAGEVENAAVDVDSPKRTPSPFEDPAIIATKSAIPDSCIRIVTTDADEADPDPSNEKVDDGSPPTSPKSGESPTGQDDPAVAGQENEKKELSSLVSYSSDVLYQIKDEVPHCQRWPKYLDESFKNTRGKWDPDRWHQNRKRGSTPPPTAGGGGEKDRPTSSLSTEGKVRERERDC